ncbi:MAG: haloalkane dehalogenase [Marinobacter sp.]|uniref:haloalkane dehalogenase n=1 Tax=Marinobacter sp. TaxID=50741 RepID=UPI0029C5D6B3|nr:haloalkane dehalogenase [Marinobacter sp.]MDX5440642.1 haloalkane dehalogenase [Alteromonadaceae bacterium]MDX5328251.1 haloalkane dehalogenase [Marinobacter sp.]MDX5336947.1 haloalkane dehalogenase [Marinobacter sp.]MDX5388175.1 haloalkane dehalogenase [Marinobacter sp.]MDX5473416.1 haloalkane dehalogenase [Marinobacter sp.]
MRILRTDEARFAGLPDYPFQANYLDVEPDLRMHFVDHGPTNATPVVMLHGEPSWSYLYRHMIPMVAEAGYRVLAPDLIGFGKSDKPASVTDYSYSSHMNWLTRWLEDLNLTNITLVCQNWGSLLGLRLAAEHHRHFNRIIVGNGMLPTGDSPVPAVFRAWKAFASHSPWFPVARIIQLGTERALSPGEMAAYEAPFPSAEFKAGARAFPGLVPVSPDDPASATNREAWRILEKWRKPFITCFSNGDPITRGGDRHMQRRIPGALGQPHITLRGGHFLQEDSPREFARVILDALKAEMAA